MERAVGVAPGPGKRLIADARLRGELELCDRWGIPHSQFRGLGTGEWTSRDRAKALAYRDYQRSVCSQCGTRAEDWDQGGDDDTEDAYVAVTHLCIGCRVIADKQDSLKTDDSSSHGKKVLLIPAAVHAATEAMKQLQAKQRRKFEDDE
ncbi:hypothetical protein ACFYXD_35055 [Streptomyces platensis]|uniref:hypothetical protein n=1 Tax=Streptomyces platensis TaxID=58346 RepID=UPI003678E573